MWRSSQDGIDVRWYLNDASLQGQFADLSEFQGVLRDLVTARKQIPAIRLNLRSTRSFQEAMVAPKTNVRAAVLGIRDKDLKAATFSWLDKAGPFVDDERLYEPDDYFEYRDVEITSTGLGEAARRVKAGTECTTFSFTRGAVDYAVNPLEVEHGLREERYGRYMVANLWQADALVGQGLAARAPVRSWAELVRAAQEHFPYLEIGPLHTNPALAREPFEASIRDRAFELLKVLNDYAAGRNQNGAEGPTSREIIQNYFTGERALFTGESPTNQKDFAKEMTFNRAVGDSYFAHWHGKIGRKYFRLHFEWPLERDRTKIEVFYLGPKITKS